MADLFSQYTSGLQFTAGTIVGSATGTSGLNPIVDRLNSISSDNGAYSNLAAGEGIDITAGSVVSCENASTTNKGVMEIATEDEVQTGTDIGRAVVPDTLQSVLSPIGAVVAWLKSFTNTPQTLPTGWVECDGSVLSDADSVYNGQTLPDLNGGNRFLRGNTTSGGTGGALTASHYHTTNFLPEYDGFDINFDTIGINTNEYRRVQSASMTAGNFGGTSKNHTITQSTSVNILPPYYDMVWIMRVK